MSSIYDSLKGIILVADDDENIREPLVEMLRLNCYRVIAVDEWRAGIQSGLLPAGGSGAARRHDAGTYGILGVPRHQVPAGDALRSGGAHYRARQRGRPHPGHRSGRGRFSAQAGEEGRAAGARAFARAAEALHRRTGKRGDRAVHPGAQHRSERSLHRGPLRPALALPPFRSPKKLDCRGRTATTCGAAESCTISARSPCPNSSC